MLAFPMEGVESSSQRNRILTVVLLVAMLVVTVVAFGVFIVITLRSAQCEVLLRATLIKQMETTQQAKRRCMNKSLAFASASHDIRPSLAAISDLIDLCRGSMRPESELAANLGQMQGCAMDLLGIFICLVLALNNCALYVL